MMNLSFKQFQDLLCKNECGFMARPSLQGYCPKCWADKCLPSSSRDEDSNKSEPNLSAMTPLPESNKMPRTPKDLNNPNSKDADVSKENADEESRERTMEGAGKSTLSTSGEKRLNKPDAEKTQELQNARLETSSSEFINKISRNTSRDPPGCTEEQKSSYLDKPRADVTRIRTEEVKPSEDQKQEDQLSKNDASEKETSPATVGIISGETAQNVDKMPTDTSSELLNPGGRNSKDVPEADCSITREPHLRASVLDGEKPTDQINTSAVPISETVTTETTTVLNSLHSSQSDAVAQISLIGREKETTESLAPKRSPSPDLELLEVQKAEPELIVIDDSEDVTLNTAEVTSESLNRLTIKKSESSDRQQPHRRTPPLSSSQFNNSRLSAALPHLTNPDAGTLSEEPPRLGASTIKENRQGSSGTFSEVLNGAGQLIAPNKVRIPSIIQNVCSGTFSEVLNGAGQPIAPKKVRIPSTIQNVCSGTFSEVLNGAGQPIAPNKVRIPSTIQNVCALPLALQSNQKYVAAPATSLLNSAVLQHVQQKTAQNRNSPSHRPQSGGGVASNFGSSFQLSPARVVVPPNVSNVAMQQQNTLPFGSQSGSVFSSCPTMQISPLRMLAPTNVSNVPIQIQNAPSLGTQSRVVGTLNAVRFGSPIQVVAPPNKTVYVITKQVPQQNHPRQVGIVASNSLTTQQVITQKSGQQVSQVHDSPKADASRSKSKSPRPIILSKSPVKVTKTVLTTQGSKGTHVVVETHPVSSKGVASGNTGTHLASVTPTSLLQPSVLGTARSTVQQKASISTSTTTKASGSNSSLWADWRRKIAGEKPSGSSSPVLKESSISPFFSQPNRSILQPGTVRQPPLVAKQTSNIPKPPQPTRLLQMFPNLSRPTSKSVPNTPPGNIPNKAPFASLIRHYNSQVHQTTAANKISAGRGNVDQPPSRNQVHVATTIPKRHRPKKPVRRLNRRPIHKCNYCCKNFSGDVRYFRNHLWIHRQKYRPYWYEQEEGDGLDSRSRPQIGRRPFMMLYTPGSRRNIRSNNKSKNITAEDENTEVCGFCNKKCEKGNALVVHENWHLKTMGNQMGHCSVCILDLSWHTNLTKHFKTLKHINNLKVMKRRGSLPKASIPVSIQTPRTMSPPVSILETAKKMISSSATTTTRPRQDHREGAPKTPAYFKGPPYKCPHCSAVWQFLSQLIQHIKTSHQQSKISKQASKGKSESKGRGESKGKNSNCNTDRRFACNRCGSSFQCRSKLERHDRETVCGRRHQKENGKQKKPVSPTKPTDSLKCTYCDANFYEQSKLSAHQLMHTRDNLYSHICSMCGASFARAELLTTHKHIHEIEMPHLCNHCTSRFSKSEDLKDHILQKHPDLKPCICEECSACFANKSDLTKHIQKAHKVPESSTEDDTIGTFGCLYCSETFKDRRDLVVHQKIHNPNSTGEEEPVVINKVLAAAKPCHICLKCGKEFRNSKSLQSHMESHRINKIGTSKTSPSTTTTSKTTANKRVASNSEAKKAKAKKFMCQICLKTFHHKAGFISHEKSHKRTAKKASPAKIVAPESDQSSKGSTLTAKNDLFSRSGILKRILGSGDVSPISDDPLSEGLSVKVCTSGESSTVDPNKNVVFEQKPNSPILVKNNQDLQTDIKKGRQSSKIAKCKYCNKLFLSKVKLKSHEKRHSVYRPYKCQHCQNRFQKLDSLQKHKTCHFPYLCRACGESLVTYSGFVNHVVTAHGEHKGNFMRVPEYVQGIAQNQPHDRGQRCLYCSRRFCRETMRVRSHIKNHLIRYKQIRCKSRVKISPISSNDNLIGDVLLKTLETANGKHDEVSHDKGNQGVIEDKKEEKQNKAPYKCEDCNQSFTLWRLREDHIRRVHKNFTCQYCHKTFLVYQILMRHEKNHRKQGTPQTPSGVSNSLQQGQAKNSTLKIPERDQKPQGTTKETEKKSKQSKKSELFEEDSTLKVPKRDQENQATVTKETEKQLKQPKSSEKFEDSTLKESVRNQEKQLIAKDQTKTVSKQQTQATGDKDGEESSLTKNSVDTSTIKIKEEPISEDSSSDSSSDSSYDPGMPNEDSSSEDDTHNVPQRDDPPKLRKENMDKNEESDEELQKKFKCETCGRSFRRRLNLLQHVRVHSKETESNESDSDAEKEFKCKSCNRSFSRNQDLLQHIKSHEQKRYKCELCPRSYDKFLLLLRHNKREHPGNKVIAPGSKTNVEENQSYTCQICFENFSEKEKMVEHKKLHSSESKFVCHVCNTVFNQSWDLIVHKRSHTREELRLCSTAQTSIDSSRQASPITVTQHNSGGETPAINSSTSKVDFKCSFCGFVCSDSSHLLLHEKTHISPNKFTCTFCGKVFDNNDKLVSHLKNVHYAQRSGDEFEKEEKSNREKEKQKRKKLDSESSDAASSGGDNDQDFQDLRGSESDSDSDEEVGHRAKIYPKRGTTRKKYIESSDDEIDSIDADSHDDTTHRYPKRIARRKSYAEPGELDLESNSLDQVDEKQEERGDEPYKCSYCGIGFTLEHDWSFHEYQHAQSEPYRCQFCYRPFSRRSNLLQHEKSHKGRKPYKCLECGKQFAMDTHLRYHKEQKHSKQRPQRERDNSKPEQDPYPYSCNLCGKGFYRRSNLVKHQDKCTEAPVKDSANMKLDSSLYVQERNAAKVARLQIAVNQTSSSTDDDDDYNGLDNDNEISSDIASKVDIKEESEVINKCRFCKRMYPNKKALMKHEIKVHKAKGPIQCGYCPRAFWYMWEKNRHEAVHTKRKEKTNQSKTSQIQTLANERDDSLKCYLCNHGFSSKQLLIDHEKTHLEQQSHKCKFCLKTFQNELDLSNHEKSHTAPEAPTSSFGCLFCHEMFTLKSALIDHIQTHSGRESYMCPHCDLTFPTSATLQAHEKEHFQPKSYKCSHCQALFSDTEKLKEHEASHQKSEYFCELCGTEFITHQGLSSHLRSKHPDAKQNSKQTNFQSILQNPNKPTLQPVVRLQSLPQTSMYSPQAVLLSNSSASGQQQPMLMSQQEAMAQTSNNAVDAILNPYSCNVCKQSFPSPDHLKKHVRTHSRKLSRKCQYCGKEFGLLSNLKKHLKLHLRSMQSTDGSGAFKCQFCGIGFEKKAAMISHVKSHGKSKVKPFSFHKRNKAFGLKTKPTIKAVPVQKVLETKQVPSKAQTSQGSSDATCKYCHRTFYNKYKMLSHIKIVHAKESPHKCNKCGLRFALEAELMRHMISHKGNSLKPNQMPSKTHKASPQTHSVGSKDATCKYCQRTFYNKYKMLKHIDSVHAKDRPHKCNECNFRFSLEIELKRHMIFHRGDTPRPHACEVCGDRFASRRSLANHMRKHTGFNVDGDAEQSLQCKFCGKLFSQLRYVRRHERLHMTKGKVRPRQMVPSSEANETPPRKKAKFSNNPLNESIASPSNKAGNSISGAGQSPKVSNPGEGDLLECKYCSIPFLKVEDLIRHERTHPGEKPYSCEDCSKNFYKRSHLTNHRAKAHRHKESSATPRENKESSSSVSSTPEGKPHPCVHCKMAFSDKSNLRKHMLKMHKLEKLQTSETQENSIKEKMETPTESSVKTLTKVREKKYSCNSCDKRYYTNSHLKDHCKRVHKQTEIQVKEEQESPKEDSKTQPKLYSCDICDRSYYLESHLKDHYAMAHNPQESQAARNQTSSQEETPIEENKYSCDVCHKIYNSSSHLKRHYERAHTPMSTEQKCSNKEKPKSRQGLHTCDICGKTCSTDLHLKEHHAKMHKSTEHLTGKNSDTSKVELQQRLYSCDVCHKSFLTDGHLEEHYATAHNPQAVQNDKGHGNESVAIPTQLREKRYACDMCDKRYYKGSHLKEHKKRVHFLKEGKALTDSNKMQGKHQTTSHKPTQNVEKSSNYPKHQLESESKGSNSKDGDGKSKESLKELVTKKIKPATSRHMKSNEMSHKKKTNHVTVIKRKNMETGEAKVQPIKLKLSISKDGHSFQSVKHSLDANMEGPIQKKLKTNHTGEGSQRTSHDMVQHQSFKSSTSNKQSQSKVHRHASVHKASHPKKHGHSSVTTPVASKGLKPSMHKDGSKASVFGYSPSVHKKTPKTLTHSSQKSKPSLHSKVHSSPNTPSPSAHKLSLPKAKKVVKTTGHSLQNVKSSHSGSAQKSVLHKEQPQSSQAFYMCHICERTFSLRSSLAVHLQNHS